MSEFGTPIDRMAAEISVYADKDDDCPGTFYASVALFDGDGACISGSTKGGFASKEEAFSEASKRVDTLVENLIDSVLNIWKDEA